MSDPFIGEIVMFAGNFAPRGWALCDGQLLAIASNPALFSILGTTYGGDGRTTFGLPDLRGRVAVHAGTGPGLSNRRLGLRFGQEQHTLTTQELPAHSHTLQASSALPNTDAASGTALAPQEYRAYDSSTAPSVAMHPSSVSSAGNGQAHNITQPSQVINFIIALQGVFPSRS